jgi:hypothetical protein
MRAADANIRQAREVVTWLKAIGENKRANDVHAVVRSLETARATLRTLYKDNMALKEQLRSQAHAAEAPIGNDHGSAVCGNFERGSAFVD